MFSKVFVQFLFLSFTFISIKATVRLPENENEIIGNRGEGEYEEPEHQHHGHHCRHHHHPNDDYLENISQNSANMLPPPYGQDISRHEMMARILPVLKKLMNRNYHKAGRIDATDESKMESQSKAKTFVMSKVNTKYTETLIENNKNNESKVLTKTLEQNRETDAIINSDSDIDVIRDKVLKSKSTKDSEPIEEKILRPRIQKFEREMSKKGDHHQDRNLRRMKREGGEGGEGGGEGGGEDKAKNMFSNIASAWKKLTDAVKEGVKTHIEEPMKKGWDQVKTQMEKLKKEHEAKKAAGGDNGKTQQPQGDAPQEAHEEK